MIAAITLHVLAATIWVGGMFFAYLVLRPATLELEPPIRLKLWFSVFQRFFRWVWLAVVILPVSGYWMLVQIYPEDFFARPHLIMMQLLGGLMIAFYCYLYFAPYRKMEKCLLNADIPAAAAQLNRIRQIVGINLALGLTLLVAGSGLKLLG